MELVTHLFTVPGVKSFLSDRLCQDILENFFGQQRQRGRINENPTVNDFIKGTQVLRVLNGLCKDVKVKSRASSSKHKKDEPASLSQPLPKRRKFSHAT